MLRLARRRWLLISSVVLLLGVPSTWLLARGTGGGDSVVVAKVKKQEFKVIVTTAGELRAQKFVPITGPANMQQADAYQVKIASIVPEGTIVKEGDVVAELDRGSLAPKIADVTLALTKAQAQYEQAMLDSTLNLSKAREEMRTMELALEEKKIANEQAKYESPSVRRTAEIDHEKATRALAQARLDYKTKTEQAQAKMREVGSDFDRQKNKLKIVQEVMQQFTIKAPSPGMVIYVKEWNGKKKTTGSQVSPWEPTIATLPDLNQMESITYVNEIDVRKVAVGQPVILTLDADPNKKLKGKVVSVANVGEQRPNADAKVFEVKVAVEQADTTLRPGMTTGNGIETYSIREALSVPIESVVSEAGVSWVYRRRAGRTVKQEIETGAINDNEVVVVNGLLADDQVLLSPPADKDKLEVVRLPGSGKNAKAMSGDTTKGASKLQVVPPKGGKGKSDPASKSAKSEAPKPVATPAPKKG